MWGRQTSAVMLVMSLIVSLPAAAQWRFQFSRSDLSLRGLSVVDGRVAWASGTGGTYLVTTDSGATWHAGSVPGADTQDFRGVVAFDSNTALLISSGPAEQSQARIYKTTNGGENWKQVFSSDRKGVFLDAIAFWDRQHGIVLSDPVDGHFILFATEDGGESWKQLAPGNMPVALPNEGAFAASNSCLIVRGTDAVWFAGSGAGVARVFHSRDRGRSWTVAATPVSAQTPASGVFSLAFRDEHNGVAVGGDYQNPSTAMNNVAVTGDGGKTWRPAQAPPSLYLSSVAYLPDNTAKDLIAVGSAGWAQSSDGGRHWTWHTDFGFNAVAFAASGSGWAVGAKGAIATWSPPSLGRK